MLAIGFGASQTGVAIAEDLATGMIDRFRSLPIASASVLGGRVTADAVRNLFVAGLMMLKWHRRARGARRVRILCVHGGARECHGGDCRWRVVWCAATSPIKERGF